MCGRRFHRNCIAEFNVTWYRRCSYCKFCNFLNRAIQRPLVEDWIVAKVQNLTVHTWTWLCGRRFYRNCRVEFNVTGYNDSIEVVIYARFFNFLNRVMQHPLVEDWILVKKQNLTVQTLRNISRSIWAINLKFCRRIGQPSWIFASTRYLKKCLSNRLEIWHIYWYILDEGQVYFGPSWKCNMAAR